MRSSSVIRPYVSNKILKFITLRYKLKNSYKEELFYKEIKYNNDK